ncbi:MAG: cache domain-containing protein, partial [Desulfobacterales bacterium]|nr:cache domain-containing protein [Desulfobacterales bacterium]
MANLNKKVSKYSKFFIKFIIFFSIFIFVETTNKSIAMQQENNLIIEIKSASGITDKCSYISSGSFIVISNSKLIEVWNFMEKKKITTLTIDEFLNIIPMELKKHYEEYFKMYNINIFHNEKISISENGEKIAMVTRDNLLTLWDINKNTFKVIAKINNYDFKLSPKGNYIGLFDSYLLSNSSEINDRSFSIIDLNKNKEIVFMETNVGMTGMINFTDDEKKIYIGVSNFFLGYEITGKNILKIKLPFTFYNRHKNIITKNQENCFITGMDTKCFINFESKKIESISQPWFDLIEYNYIQNYERDIVVSLDDIIAGKNKRINIPVYKEGITKIIDNSIYHIYDEKELGDFIIHIEKHSLTDKQTDKQNNLTCTKEDIIKAVDESVAILEEKGEDALEKVVQLTFCGDNHVMVSNLYGIVLMSINPNLVGKNIIFLKDDTGKEFIKDFINVAKSSTTKINGKTYFNGK